MLDVAWCWHYGGKLCLYVKVGKLNHLEHSQIWLVTDNQVGIVRLTIQQEMIVSDSFMYYPVDFLRQTSADIVFITKCPIPIWQLCNSCCCTLQVIPGNELTTSDHHIVNHRMVGDPSNLHPYTAGINLCIMYKLATTYAILTWS
jgi:hypothetical protein